MIKLVASDLDGTIIDKDNDINKDNFKAISDINKSNIPFVICTGKTYSIYKGLCSSFHASYGIFGNGTSIIDLKNDKEIYQSLLDKSTVLDIIKLAKENNLHVHVYTRNQIITEELLYLDLRNYKLQKNNIYNNKLEFKIVPNLLKYLLKKDTDISKIVISSTNSLESIKNMICSNFNVSVFDIKKYGKYKDKIIDKEYEYLDIIPKDVSKGNALKFLSNYLQINENEILAVGDNLNDLDMLKNAGIGIAVNNAYSEIKQVANYVTERPVEKGAFAEAVYKFIKF
ncbi:MAG: HAD family hydrolase [Clostridia bacterium]